MFSNRTFQRSIVIACFFLSGCAALIYEVIWVRIMTLFLGNSQWAVSTVIAAFMTGLAAGSFFGGKISDHFQKKYLLKIFILLELGIAVSAVLSKPIINIVQNVTLACGILTLPFWLQSILWFVLGFGILVIPTALMGATLPVLARWFIDSYEETGNMLGKLYAVNTLGAVLGVSITGFYLIQYWGMTKTLLFAGGMNGFCAVIIFLLLRQDTKPVQEVPRGISHASASTPFLTFTILFLAGFAAMVCQIVWNRLMVLVLGSSTYAFSTILITFLLGISLGSAACAHILKKHRPSWSGVGFVGGILFAVIIGSMALINRLPFLLVQLYPLVFQGFIPIHCIHLFLCVIVMLIPTLCMGVLFPLIVSSAIKGNNSVGLRIGTYTMVSIMGNVFGALAAGFLFIPFIGTEYALVIAITLYAIVSVIAWFQSGYIHRKKVVLFVVLIFLFGITLRPRLSVPILSSGAFLYAPQLKHLTSFAEFKEFLNRNEILYHKDGFSSTVTVLHSPWNERFLRINGKTDASWGTDMKTQLLLAYLPRLIFQGQPEHALIIGLGAGVTAGACAVDKNIKTIDCIELEPAVSKAAMFFTRVNKWVMKDQRFNLIFTDARHYLNGTGKKYDLIISEPSNPWMAGIATLYTQEAFNLVKERLSAPGIFCQWIHSYSMSEKDFKMILKTFVSVFPHSMLFTPRENDFLILGSLHPLVFDYPAVQKIMNNERELLLDLQSIGVGHPFTLLATTFVLDDEDIRAYVERSEIHRDNRLTLEFSAPLFLHRGEDMRIALSLQQAKKLLLPKHVVGLNPAPGEWAFLYNLVGEAFMRLRNAESAAQWFQKAKKIKKEVDARTLTNLARIENIQNRDFKAEELYKKAIRKDPGYALAYFHLGQLYAIKGLEEKGMQYLEEGMARKPKDPVGTIMLGSLYLKHEHFKDARVLFEHTLTSKTLTQNIRYQIEQALAETKKNIDGVRHFR